MEYTKKELELHKEIGELECTLIKLREINDELYAGVHDSIVCLEDAVKMLPDCHTKSICLEQIENNEEYLTKKELK